MSRIAVTIEDRLHKEGYKTERNGAEVQVFDPVWKAVAGSRELVLDHYDLVEIRTIDEAWEFISQRA